MPQQTTPAKLLKKIPGSKLLLIMDYDGTLVPIASTPEKAVPPGYLLKLLQNLAKTNGIKNAVVSGRTVAQLEKWLPTGDLYLAGTHGASIKEPGENTINLLDIEKAREDLAVILQKAREVVHGKKGFIIEDKDISLAFHYRMADPGEAEEACKYFRSLAQKHLSPDYTLLEGKKVIEIRPQNLHKGRPVEWLTSRYPGFHPVYLGDDTTDEDAFYTIKKHGTGVLVSPEDRPSHAHYCLNSPEEVQEFLQLVYRHFTTGVTPSEA